MKKIKDPQNDEIGVLLKYFHEINSWTTEKHSLFAQLISQVENENYIKFIADSNKTGLSSIGASCLFDIPEKKRGSLALFKGQRIRVICISKEKYSRFNYAAKQLES